MSASAGATPLAPEELPALAKILTVRRLRLDQAADAESLRDLLDHYARDPMGGGAGLSAEVRNTLVARLLAVPHYHGGVACLGDTPVGLINCFTGFSTFAAQPLLNVHDLVVREGYRAAGVGQALLQWAEQTARELGCCKLTLEVLTGNAPALRSYQRAGFKPYALDPAAGQAVLLQKKL